MSPMNEPFYPTLPTRPEHHTDFTPYSPVSSFNIPYNYDSSLITPVSLTQPLTVNTKSAYCSPREMEIKLSPSTLSPGLDLFNTEEEHPSDGRKSPMRYKDPQRRLHISTPDQSFPGSPCVPSPPYFGSYGVSATPSLVQSESSPVMNPSPHTHHSSLASGIRGENRHTRLPTPTQSQLRRPGEHIHIAPNPPSLEPTLHNDPFRQNPLAPLHSLGIQGSSATYKPYSNPAGSFPAKNHRKRKNSCQSGDILLSGDMTFEEQILMQLTEVDRLPWKEVAIKFKERTGKDMRVPALQMRKKRLLERLRVWTPTDERALLLATQSLDKTRWDLIASAMLKYGCVEKWSKDTVQKKWYEMHPENEYSSEYEDSRTKRRLTDEYGIDAFSEARDGLNYNLSEANNGTLMPAQSHFMNDTRSRTSSVASSHYSIEQQVVHHLKFELRE